MFEPSTRSLSALRRIAVLAAVGITASLFALASTAWASAATATLRFEVSGNAGATVFVDGRELGSTPLSTEVQPGDHEVQLIWDDGRRSGALKVHLETGDRRTLRLAAKAETKQGTLAIVVGDPAATVHLNGRLVGTGPIRLQVAPGKHDVVIAFADGTVARRTLEVRAGATISLRLRE